MTINKLFDGTSQLLIKTAELRQRKGEVIAANIANLETPGYQARDFKFSDALRHATANPTSSPTMLTTHATHLGGRSSLSGIRGTYALKHNQLGGFDGNSVNLDQEMADQAINSGAYNRTMQMLKSKMAILKNAIIEGGK
ncbi:MAG: flagellar basal body rod protein FlgB [Deltaproteobacteria bacterium]|nr:flagellar basal body rod protein FlgB [Deltaproteobacteria bacterium]